MLVEEDVEDDLILDLLGYPSEMKHRASHSRPNYRESLWSLMLKNPEIVEPSSKVGKQFRRRFTIPFSLFQHIMSKIREEHWFSEGPHCAPLELKVLGVFRVLGRATCFDGINELSLISEEVHRVFFHKFTEKFVERFFTEFVHPPQNSEELNETVEIYAKLGLHGAMSSTDGVHLSWQACPAMDHNMHVGKDHEPTLGYQATVNHKKQFTAFSPSLEGGRNDMTAAKYYQHISDLRDGKFTTKLVLHRNTVNGESSETIDSFKLFTLVDGGYHHWMSLMCGLKIPSTEAEGRYTAQMESVRKDVECAFGILKKRFLCLRHILFQERYQIDKMVHTCVIIHNMLLKHDGYLDKWSFGSKWDEAAGELTPEEDIEDDWPLEDRAKQAIFHHTNFQMAVARNHQRKVPTEQMEVEHGWYGFRQKLIANFDYWWEKSKIKWLQ